jgi:hypothetical protein
MSLIEHSVQPEGYFDLAKVVFEVPADSIVGAGTETMWAEHLGTDTYRLRNIPFYVMGVSFEDVIRAREKDDELFFSKVVAPAGHSTYRVFLGQATTEADFLGLWEPLERLGCSFEGATPRLFAIDVPPEADIYTIYGLLEKGEAAGFWDFQEGHCGHPVHKNHRSGD